MEKIQLLLISFAMVLKVTNHLVYPSMQLLIIEHKNVDAQLIQQPFQYIEQARIEIL